MALVASEDKFAALDHVGKVKRWCGIHAMVLAGNNHEDFCSYRGGRSRFTTTERSKDIMRTQSTKTGRHVIEIPL